MLAKIPLERDHAVHLVLTFNLAQVLRCARGVFLALPFPALELLGFAGVFFAFVCFG
jgi:hypothetical protein